VEVKGEDLGAGATGQESSKDTGLRFGVERAAAEVFELGDRALVRALKRFE